MKIGVCVLVGLFPALIAGCDSDSREAERLHEGIWGGEGARLDVASSEVRTYFDCAEGRIEGSVTFGTDGSFRVTGTYIPGPVAREVVSARYDGRVDSDRMNLSVTLVDTEDVLGPFELVRGEAGNVVLCR